MNPIVFVGGVHGVGKTTVSRQLGVSLQASHLTAGTLIREAVNAASQAATSTNKGVADVDANQVKLLRGLELYRARSCNGPIVLDGHFALLSLNDAVTEIPLTVFREIAPVALLLVETTIPVIHARLMKRDGRAPSLAVITALATRENAYAHAISENLAVPIFVVSGDSDFNVIAQSVCPRIRTILDAIT
jgi:adenylate kinase